MPAIAANRVDQAAETSLPVRHLRVRVSESWLALLVLGVGGLNLAVLAGQLPGLVGSLYRNADSAVGLVLADGLGAKHDPGAVITLGHYHYYEAWLLETATRALPDHWHVWEAMPFVIAFLGIALMGWAACRVFGRFAAMLTVVVMLSPGNEMREILFTPDTHGYFVAHTALLAAALVFVADRACRGPLSSRLLIGVALPVVALSAVAGTDELFEVVALPSLALAGWMGWWLHPGEVQRRLAFFCIGVCAASIAGAQLLDGLMSTNHVVSSPFGISFLGSEAISFGAITSNVTIAVTALTNLAGGSVLGTDLLGVGLLLFAIGCVARLGKAVLQHLFEPPSSRALASRDGSTTLLRDLYTRFWTLVVALSLAAYVLTNLPTDAGTARYLPGVFAGAAALMGALAGTRHGRRALLSLAVAAFAIVIATNHVIQGTPAFGPGPPPSTSQQMLRFARANGATRGYAPYWDAAVMTWQTSGALKAYPAELCGAYLCPFPFNRSSAWYRPESGVHSFLVTQRQSVTAEAITSSPASLGKPARSAQYGAYIVFVYDHDLAADLR